MPVYYLVVTYDIAEFEFNVEYSSRDAIAYALDEISEALAADRIALDIDVALEAEEIAEDWENNNVSVDQVHSWMDWYNDIAPHLGVPQIAFGKVYEPYEHAIDLREVALELIDGNMLEQNYLPEFSDDSTVVSGKGKRRRTERHKTEKTLAKQERIERVAAEPPSWRILLTRKAVKAENKMPKDVRKVWGRKKYGLAVNPYNNDGKDKATIKSPEETAWKLRVGINWRALFTIDSQSKTVTVFWLGTRESF